jgi:hypothetical protein
MTLLDQKNQKRLVFSDVYAKHLYLCNFLLNLNATVDLAVKTYLHMSVATQ